MEQPRLRAMAQIRMSTRETTRPLERHSLLSFAADSWSDVPTGSSGNARSTAQNTRCRTVREHLPVPQKAPRFHRGKLHGRYETVREHLPVPQKARNGRYKTVGEQLPVPQEARNGRYKTVREHLPVSR